MSDNLVIRDIAISIDGRTQEISADVGGTSIWFRVPLTVPLFLRSEPFVAAALLEAMYTGQDIEIACDVPFSNQLFESLEYLQGIYRCWNEELKTINIITSLTSSREERDEVGSFFSAGVDSSYTLMQHRDEITNLIIMDAFDQPCAEDIWSDYVEKQTVFAEAHGKQLISVQTNVRQYAEDKKISWEFMHGLILSTVGGLFGFRKIFVPSTYSYRDLFPWGSHPLTDPLWSTENVRIVHDGAGSRRWEKMKKLTECPEILDNLRICWRSKVSNCGVCPKCIRTMLALHLLGASSSGIPAYAGTDQLKHLKAMDDHAAVYLEDAMLAAKAQGDHVIYRKLYWYFKIYKVIGLIETIDKVMLGGLVRGLYRYLKKPAWLSSRVSLGEK